MSTYTAEQSLSDGLDASIKRHFPAASPASVLANIGHYQVSLRKFRSTWNYFTTNPQGGGFGSNLVGSKKSALSRAIANIPDGSTVLLITENEGREVSRLHTTVMKLRLG